MPRMTNDDDTPALKPIPLDIIVPGVWTEDDDLGDVPESDMDGDQTGGRGPL